MTSISTAAAQQKFTSLRKRLDQLGYRQPLGVESLPLVEKLFADLLHTTESLKKSKVRTMSTIFISAEFFWRKVNENTCMYDEDMYAHNDIL